MVKGFDTRETLWYTVECHRVAGRVARFFVGGYHESLG